jgi:hypothetical protein
MDFALTRRGDYAVRAALCLAKVQADGRYLKIREVAAAMDLARGGPHVQDNIRPAHRACNRRKYDKVVRD